MLLKSLLALTAAAATGAVSIPLAELERRYEGTHLAEWTQPRSVPGSIGKFTLAPRMAGGSAKQNRAPPPKQIPRKPRGLGKAYDEVEYPHYISKAVIEKHAKGTNYEMSQTPEAQDGRDGFTHDGIDAVSGRNMVTIRPGKKLPGTALNSDAYRKQYPNQADRYHSPDIGADHRGDTINDIRHTPKWAAGTHKDESQYNSVKTVRRDPLTGQKGGFVVGRVDPQESVTQSSIVGQARARYGNDVLLRTTSNLDPNKNPMRDRPLLRGYDDGTPGSIKTPYPISKIQDATFEAFLGPNKVPVRGTAMSNGNPRNRRSDTQFITLAPHSRQLSRSPPADRPLTRPVITEIKPRGSRKRDIISTISQQEGNSTSSTNADDQLDAATLYGAFVDAQNNATALLQPFFEDLLNGTNSLLGEAMVWGLYMMTVPSISLSGPFTNEYSLFSSVANSTEGLVPSGNDWTAWAADVDDFYHQYYTTAYNEVNKTGLLANLELYAEALSLLDPSLLPDEMTAIPDDHTIEPLIPFLQEMYAYNAFPFTSNEAGSGNSTQSNSTNSTSSMYTLDDENFTSFFTTIDDPNGVFILGYSDGASNVTELQSTLRSLNATGVGSNFTSPNSTTLFNKRTIKLY